MKFNLPDEKSDENIFSTKTSRDQVYPVWVLPESSDGVPVPELPGGVPVSSQSPGGTLTASGSPDALSRKNIVQPISCRKD